VIYRVLIIGLGQIGMGYDVNQDPRKFVLTHARAFQQHEKFQLAAAVDTDITRREAFERVYSVKAFSSIEEAAENNSIDIVVVATPTSLHLQTIETLFQYFQPKALVCEKPLALELYDARKIVELCAENKCQLFVNYMRRADPGVLEIKQRIENGVIAYPIKAVVWYSKGLFNNGSHFLNLLLDWLGNAKGFHIIDRGRMWEGVDPEPDVAVEFERGKAIFLAAREEDYSHYSIELVASNGRLRYEQGGNKITWQGVVDDEVCDGYSVLGSNEESIESNLDKSQWQVVEQLAEALEGNAAYISEGSDALQTLEILSSIRNEL
jgi:predicted dehydrogenase